MKYIYSFCILLSCYTFSAIVYEFDNEADESRFNNLIKEIRCPKCTSGSLYSSNAPVSEDLKKRIAEMINQGKSNTEIKEYVARTFGKESLYEPDFNKSTYFLWFSPFIFLFLALTFFLFRPK